MNLRAEMVSKDEARQRWRDSFQNRDLRRVKAAEVAVRAAGDGVTEILLYDEIGFWGVTAKEFVTQLASVGTPVVRVRINSPGGDVFDGLAIYNALRAYQGEVICQIDGWAASAASAVALAGSRTVIADNAMMMCHRAWSFGIGNSADMEDMAATLQKIDSQLAGIYARKTGRTVEDCAAMMAGDVDGTWFSATEAKAFGLVDDVFVPAREPDEPASNGMSGRVIAMRRRLAIAEAEI